MTQPKPLDTEEKTALAKVMQDEVVLLAMREKDPARYRQLHEQALAYLNAQIEAGAEVDEGQWTAVFDRLAYLYVADDSKALIQLSAQTDQLPLRTKAAQNKRAFFQGMALVRQDLYADALGVFDELLGEEELPIALKARTLNARAVICRINGRFEEAVAGYQASLDLWQQLGDHHYQGIVHLNLGIIAYNLRDYAKANNHYHQAAQFFTLAGSHSWLITVQNELGLVQRDLGHWDEAIASFEQIIIQRSQDEADEDVGMGYANLGEVLLFKGDIEGAKTALNEALQRMVSRTYRVDHLLYLGLAFQAEGNLAEATSYFEASRELAQALNRREALPAVYYHLGDAARQQGHDAAALAFWQQAADVIEATQEPLKDESLKISLLGRWQQVYEALILHCFALGRVEEAFAWAERARARAFAEGLTGDEQEVQQIISLPELQAAIPENTTMLCYFTTGVLEQDMPLLQAIPKNNPLRDHILTPAKTLLFAITAAEMSVHECPLDPNVFATSSPRGFDAKRFLKTAVLRRLHSDLLTPYFVGRNTDYGTQPTDHFIIIPHGPLHRVPFTALLAQDENPPTLSFAPSGTIFARKRFQRRLVLSEVEVGAEAQRNFCLAVGYNDIRGPRYLKYADEEVAAVAQMMRGEAWLGSEPKKVKLAERAAACQWLHIACHGWFDDADPLASYLETGDDERLTARDVMENWSLQAELVTLSACETGVSQILRGDEPMGLVRAFLYAGAKSVLVSQWPVDDLATFLLMIRFYQALQATPMKTNLTQRRKDAEKKPRSSAHSADFHLSLALAQAQAWLRGATAVTIQQTMQAHGLLNVPTNWLPDSKPFAAPEFWAGFILI